MKSEKKEEEMIKINKLVCILLKNKVLYLQGKIRDTTLIIFKIINVHLSFINKVTIYNNNKVILWE